MGQYKHTGVYVVAGCMLFGVVLFQLGHAYRRYRKNRRNHRKQRFSGKSDGESSDVEIHEKGCPKYSVNHRLAGEQFFKEKGETMEEVKFKHRMNGNDEGFDEYKDLMDSVTNYLEGQEEDNTDIRVNIPGIIYREDIDFKHESLEMKTDFKSQFDWEA